jgi:pimeloyl-ACP methyl ester carboxylesterase
MQGWIDDLHVWDPVIAELSGSGFETVQLDLAGFGNRAQANGLFTFGRFADDLLAVVDAVDKPFVLVGHSMAAPIVELVAEARLDRALGLVLLAPIPMAGARLPGEVIENFRSLAGAEASAIQAMRQQAGPSAPEAELARIATVAAKARPEVVLATADLWNNGHPVGRPSGFSKRVLILSGGDDPIVTSEVVASAVVARFDSIRFDSTKATTTEIEQCSHWPHIEQPSLVATQINRFLPDSLATDTACAVARHSQADSFGSPVPVDRLFTECAPCFCAGAAARSARPALSSAPAAGRTSKPSADPARRRHVPQATHRVRCHHRQGGSAPRAARCANRLRPRQASGARRCC